MTTTSRRAFLVKTAGLTVCLPRLAARMPASAALASETQADDDAFWQMVREQFPFREDKVPMNAANLCPSPREVADRVTELTHDIDVDCSFNNRAKFADLLERSRSKVARQLGVSPNEIALVRNTSEANNTINNGLPLKRGDEVVVWDQNHPTNNVAWDVRAARSGFGIKRVSTPLEPKDKGELVEAFRCALTSKTRVLAITHVSNISGLRLPVRQLCEEAHRRDIYVHVDGAQTWGALELNLRDLGCDSFTASAHKWFCGPKEAGLLYVRCDRIAAIWPNVVAPGWGNDAEPDVRGARKFESLGQRDDACLAAVGTAADFHASIGTKRVEKRVLELAAALKQRLAAIGARLVTPMDRQLSAGVCIIDAPAENRGEVFNRMYDEHGIAGSTSGGFRLCPHVYNTSEHVDRAVRGIESLRRLLA